MLSKQLRMLMLLVSATCVNAIDQCQPMKLGIDYAGFRAMVEDIPADRNEQVQLLRSTLESFEVQMPLADTYEMQSHILSQSFKTVDLIMNQELFQNSEMNDKYQSLRQNMNKCKGQKIDSDLQQLLTIKVSESGKKHIEKEVNDVKKMAVHEAKFNDHRLVNIFIRLLQYKDTKNGKELQSKAKELAYSEQSQKIKQEMSEVVHDLERNVHVGDKSIQVDNEKLKKIVEKVDGINKDYEDLKKTKEFKELKNKLNEERQNPKIKKIEINSKKFLESQYGQRIQKELRDIELAANKEAQYEDLPWGLQVPEFKGFGLIQ